MGQPWEGLVVSIYKRIQREVCSAAGFVPASSWIAHVLDEKGLTKRKSVNRICPWYALSLARRTNGRQSTQP